MTACRLSKALACLSLIGLPAVAAPAAPSDTPAAVVVGGTLIHTVRTTWGGLSPKQRADREQQRLVTALAQGPVYAKDISVGQVQGDWCVLFRGQRFLTADPLTAQQEHSTPQVLVGEWAVRLRQVLPDLTRPQQGKPAGAA